MLKPALRAFSGLLLALVSSGAEKAAPALLRFLQARRAAPRAADWLPVRRALRQAMRAGQAPGQLQAAAMLALALPEEEDPAPPVLQPCQPPRPRPFGPY